MAIAHDILTSKVQRLMLDKKQKERLIKELHEVDEEKLKFLAGLIREHDEEALEILGEKSAEQLKVKEELLAANPNPIEPDPFTAADGETLADVLEECFADPHKMAQFLNTVDDSFLVKLEEIFSELLADQPENQKQFQHFFREVRLQKNSFAHEIDVAYKEALIENIAKDQKYGDELDKLIAEAEELLNQK